MENFDFSKPNFGLNEEQFKELTEAPVLIEKALIEKFSTEGENDDVFLDFVNIFETISKLNLTKEQLVFTISSVLFNDIMSKYQEDMIRNLQEQIQSSIENEEN